MRLPPYGNQFQPVPCSGVRVAIGTDSWVYRKLQRPPIMLLPEYTHPADYDWPLSPDKCALIIETGPPDDSQLDAMADALIQTGHRFVMAVRQSQFGKNEDPYIYYEAEYV